MTRFELHVSRWKDCTSCPLHEGRTHVVFARGSIPCDVLFIGEAPGVSEDALGQPFVGPAGKLLDGIIRQAIGDKSYALTNLVGCYPKEEKDAGTNEPPNVAIKACSKRLKEFVRMCEPNLIVLVGKLAKRHVYGAAQFRLDDEAEQPEWIPEGKFLNFVELVHPAAILRGNIAQRGLMLQRAVVTLSNAVDEI